MSASGTVVTAYIRPEDVRVIYPDRPLTRVVRTNLLDGIVVERRRGRHVHQLRVALPGGSYIEIVYPTSAYATLPLTPGAPVQLALRQESIVVIAPRDEDRIAEPDRASPTVRS